MEARLEACMGASTRASTGAVVPAEPAPESRARGRRRYALPLLLVAGWVGLFAYSGAYLTEDLPFRPQPAEASQIPEAQPRRVVVLDAPAPERTPGAASKPVAAVASLSPAAPRAPVAAPPRPAPASPDYVGVWGPTAFACGARSRRRGYLPATITADRATAGRTQCSFHDGRRAGSAWTLAAECSERGRRWTSQVRLVVDGDRLTWSSGRGTATYVRCGRSAG